MNKHACGPEHDEKFFSELHQVMRRYPDLAKKYHVVCSDHETDIMHIDFDKEVARKQIEGRRIVIEFVERDKIQQARPKNGSKWVCCDWCPTDGGYRCCGWWKE